MYINTIDSIFICSLLMSSLITVIDNYGMKIVESCLSAKKHLYFKWALTEYNQVMKFWYDISILISKNMIIRLHQSTIQILNTKCANSATIIDIHTIWITDINKNCLKAFVEIRLSDYTKYYTDVKFEISPQKECHSNFYNNSLNQRCLDLPQKINKGEHLIRDIKCKHYTKKKLIAGSKTYELVLNKTTRIEKFSLAGNTEKFEILSGGVDNSNLNIEIYGLYFVNLTIDFFYGIVKKKDIMKIRVYTIQEYTLPSVQGLIEFVNIESFVKFTAEIFTLRFRVDKLAPVILNSLYCIQDKNIVNVFGNISETNSKLNLIIHPKLCCLHNITLEFKIIHDQIVTINEYKYHLQCLESESDHFKRHVEIIIDSKSQKTYTEIKISTHRVHNIKSVRINITDDIDNFYSVLCEILTLKCSSVWFRIVAGNVITGNLPKTHFYQSITLEGSYDNEIFHKYKHDLYISHYNKSEIIQVIEDVKNMFVTFKILTIDWSFHKYKYAVKNFEVSVSWKHGNWVKVGKCENISKCIIFSSYNVKSLEFHRIELNYNGNNDEISGFIMMSFTITFYERFNMSDASIRIMKRYDVFESPRAKITLKYFYGRNFYTVFVESSILKYFASITLQNKDIACSLSENCKMMSHLSKTYITSKKNVMMTLFKLRKEAPRFFEIISVKYQTFGTSKNAEYTENRKLFATYDICRLE